MVCGDREWEDYELILSVLSGVKDDAELVIHGACRGADKLGGKAADELGIPVKPVPANWGMHGSLAGPIRNRKMLEDMEAGKDVVLAFHTDLANSRGTKHMVSIARQKGVEVRLFDGRASDG